MKPGTLIVFEGLDGCGKSTQLPRLAHSLAEHFDEIVETREPTDGEYGRRIREMAASGRAVSPDEELRWFLEDRLQHVEELIAPALAQGKLVLSDRYYLSTVAYQGARGNDPIAILARSERECPKPDLALLLEIDPAEGLRRIAKRASQAEPHFESLDFLTRVAAIFASLDRPYLERIDGRRDPDAVHTAILACVRRRLGVLR